MWGPRRIRFAGLIFLGILLLLKFSGILAYLHIPACSFNIAGCHNNLIAIPGIISPVLLTIGTTLNVIGLIIAITARRTLADNWSGDIEIKKDHKLITTGIYKYVRHPIYTGVIAMALGTILLIMSINAFIFFGIISALMIFKLKQEEKLLTKYFPKEYPEYKKRTKGLIPFIY